MQYTLKGETFTSDLTNQEAVEIVSKLTSTFALSLATQYARKGRLSDRQWPWVHKLAVATLAPKVAPEAIQELPSCKEIVSLFSHATAKGMKRPKMIFPQAKFSLAGIHSRNAGSIHVAQGSYPGKYFGYITPEGQFVPGRNFKDLDLAFLATFAQDPKNYAISSGLELGSCRFCQIELSTPESLSVGYGPKCAQNWGLPWGKVSR